MQLGMPRSAIALLLTLACSGPATEDAGLRGSDAGVDTGVVDAGAEDGGIVDAGPCAERFGDCSAMRCCAPLMCVGSGSGTGDGGTTMRQCL
ncbi:MAG: hypothetical protein AB7S26_36445 [Sandaracinaceae bacterium]